MYCRICGAKIPDDSAFCPNCGREVAAFEAPAAAVADSPAAPDTEKVFTFPENTTFDQAAKAVNEWLAEGGRRILSTRFTMDAILLAGTIVPTVSRLEVDWEAEPDGSAYQLGFMIDSCTDFGLGKKRGEQKLTKQFDRWHGEHPECEITGFQQTRLSLGWTSAWATCFFFR